MNLSERISENIIICLDNSRSMFRDDYKPNRFEACKKAVQTLVEERIRSDSSTTFSLLTFSDTVLILVDFTNTPRHINEVLKNIQIKGSGPALGDALAVSIKILIEELRKIAAKVPRIVIFSDGNYSNTAVNPIKMARLCQGLNLKIDCFKIGEISNENILKTISDLSKGNYFYSNDSQTLQEAVKGYANSNLKSMSSKSESLENPTFLRKIAANLLRVQDLTKDQEQRVKQMRGVADYKKCSICFSDKDPSTKASFFISGRYCPNCQTPFHINCLAEWASSQESPNLRKSGTVRCPHCYYLLKIPTEVTQVKRLKILSKKELHKQIGAEPSEKFKALSYKASELGTEALYNSCPVCNMIFEEHQDVIKCGNPDCGILYHKECFEKISGQCKSCGAKLEV